MLRSCSHVLVTFVFLLLALFFSQVHGKHHTCSWKVGTGTPENLGYKHFCTAPPVRSRYFCDHSNRFYANRQVGDWGFIAPGTLEAGTPCGNQGYGFSVGGDPQCLGLSWLICPNGVTDASKCYGLGDKDDCAWPVNELTGPPSKLDIYYK
ncbi:unnamed protein product [Jaminaea pallidilutea]